MTGKGILMMSREELRRVNLIRKILDGEMRQREVAEILDLSDRQVRRIVSRVRGEGDEGAIHELRGEPSHRAIEKRIKGVNVGFVCPQIAGLRCPLFAGFR